MKLTVGELRMTLKFLSYSLKNEEDGKRYFKLEYTVSNILLLESILRARLLPRLRQGEAMKLNKFKYSWSGCVGSFIVVVAIWCSKVSLQFLCRFLIRPSYASSLSLLARISVFVVAVLTIPFRHRSNIFFLNCLHRRLAGYGDSSFFTE